MHGEEFRRHGIPVMFELSGLLACCKTFSATPVMPRLDPARSLNEQHRTAVGCGDGTGCTMAVLRRTVRSRGSMPVSVASAHCREVKCCRCKDGR